MHCEQVELAGTELPPPNRSSRDRVNIYTAKKVPPRFNPSEEALQGCKMPAQLWMWGSGLRCLTAGFLYTLFGSVCSWTRGDTDTTLLEFLCCCGHALELSSVSAFTPRLCTKRCKGSGAPSLSGQLTSPAMLGHKPVKTSQTVQVQTGIL